MTDTEFGEMFESDGEVSRVRSWIREGISWQLGDAGDPGLVGVIGRQDMVVASNFLWPHGGRGSGKLLAEHGSPSLDFHGAESP
jgi:hypothetical protein